MGEITNDRIARYLALIAPEREAATLEELFQRIGEGDETLYDVCRAWDVPAGRILTWLMASESRYAAYKRALEIAAHQLVSQTVAIADEQKEAVRKDGSTFDPDVSRDKLRIDTRLRLAKYHAPERYGDTSEGKGGGITVIVNRGSPEPPAGAGAEISPGVTISKSGNTLSIGA